MHYSWRNPCSNLPQSHPGSKVQCHNLHQNIAVAALDQGMLVPSPWRHSSRFPRCWHPSSPEAGKHTLNNQFHYKEANFQARASGICIFVNWVLDLFKHRSKAVCDKHTQRSVAGSARAALPSWTPHFWSGSAAGILWQLLRTTPLGNTGQD